MSQDDLKAKVEATEFVVEATRNEQFMLWQQHRHEVQWDQDHFGFGPQIGELDGRPICMSLSWAVLNGHRIMFYEAISQVTDSEQVDAWLKANCNPTWQDGKRRAHADAANFHLVLEFVGALPPEDPERAYKSYRDLMAELEQMRDRVEVTRESRDDAHNEAAAKLQSEMASLRSELSLYKSAEANLEPIAWLVEVEGERDSDHIYFSQAEADEEQRQWNVPAQTIAMVPAKAVAALRRRLAAEKLASDELSKSLTAINDLCTKHDIPAGDTHANALGKLIDGLKAKIAELEATVTERNVRCHEALLAAGEAGRDLDSRERELEVLLRACQTTPDESKCESLINGLEVLSEWECGNVSDLKKLKQWANERLPALKAAMPQAPAATAC